MLRWLEPVPLGVHTWQGPFTCLGPRWSQRGQGLRPDTAPRGSVPQTRSPASSDRSRVHPLGACRSPHRHLMAPGTLARRPCAPQSPARVTTGVRAGEPPSRASCPLPPRSRVFTGQTCRCCTCPSQPPRSRPTLRLEHPEARSGLITSSL